MNFNILKKNEHKPKHFLEKEEIFENMKFLYFNDINLFKFITRAVSIKQYIINWTYNFPLQYFFICRIFKISKYTLLYFCCLGTRNCLGFQFLSFILFFLFILFAVSDTIFLNVGQRFILKNVMTYKFWKFFLKLSEPQKFFFFTNNKTITKKKLSRSKKESDLSIARMYWKITKEFQSLSEDLFQEETKPLDSFEFELRMDEYLGWVYDEQKGFRSKEGRSQDLRQWLNSTKARKWADTLFGDMFESCRQ
ncbi:hypothetical protein RFI_13587, partial [Reticulomyxa filosa]